MHGLFRKHLLVVTLFVALQLGCSAKCSNEDKDAIRRAFDSLTTPSRREMEGMDRVLGNANALSTSEEHGAALQLISDPPKGCKEYAAQFVTSITNTNASKATEIEADKGTQDLAPTVVPE